MTVSELYVSNNVEIYVCICVCMYGCVCACVCVCVCVSVTMMVQEITNNYCISKESCPIKSRCLTQKIVYRPDVKGPTNK